MISGADLLVSSMAVALDAWCLLRSLSQSLSDWSQSLWEKKIDLAGFAGDAARLYGCHLPFQVCQPVDFFLVPNEHRE